MNELKILRDQELLIKINNVIDALFENKYGLYLGNYTDDLTEASLNNVKEWIESGDSWNNV